MLKMGVEACSSGTRALGMAAGAFPSVANAFEIAAQACSGGARALEMAAGACPSGANAFKIAAQGRFRGT